MTLYSRMTPDELQAEMRRVQQSGQVAYDKQNWSEYEILMKKWYLAKSYLILDSFPVQIGQTYSLIEEPDTFTVTKVEGVMAWGKRRSTQREGAVPIAMLSTDPPTR
jgi:Protein of unknown function (DUF1811)